MELIQLEHFMALCEEMHFTKTAEKLRIGQPALSYRIKTLEDELGVRLFDRLGKKIAITEAGKIFLEHCKMVFANLESAKEQIEDLQNVKRGKLVIGTLPGYLNLITSTVLLEFHSKYPDVQIQIFCLDDGVKMVIQNEIDLVLTLMPGKDERLTTISLYEEEFFLAVGRDHVWSDRNAIDFKEIERIPLILSNCFRQSLDAACSAAGIKIQPIIESTDLESILNLVKKGIGATIISKTLFSLENEGELKAIRIINPVIIREVTIVHHKQKHLGTAAKGFIELLIGHVNRCNMQCGSSLFYL
ncbi:MAG: LysR family transcriptional regulator [Bacillota bacterium]